MSKNDSLDSFGSNNNYLEFMNRRRFIEQTGTGLFTASTFGATPMLDSNFYSLTKNQKELIADIVIAGGGLGGCAAAITALRQGKTVIMTEETSWLGGQISQQGVPPDEHHWIETKGAPQSYRNFRNAIREYYKANYPLINEAKMRPFLNPGDGGVSRICHEPKVTVAVLMNMFAPYLSSGSLTLLIHSRIIGANVKGDQITALKVKNLMDDNELVLNGTYFVDGTETGELLPLSGTEYVAGSEAKADTHELHAAEVANRHNNQAFTMCLAMDYVKGEDHIIDKPKEYPFWKNFIPKMKSPWSGNLLGLSYSDPKTLKPKELGFHPEGTNTPNKLNLWNYRKIINQNNFDKGFYQGDITIMNWPQNDYFLGDIIDVSESEFIKHVNRGKQLSLSLFYWLQTEAPRPDGGLGWKGLRLRGDVLGTQDGLAMYPYIRESRRIKPLFRILEEHVGAENRKLVAGEAAGKTAAIFKDSVGIGYYHIDLHPSSAGDNYIDFGSLPFQIPLGALIPERVTNLLPANKNIGTTHITNGCYRLHPVEWSIGVAVGLLITQCMKLKTIPKHIYEKPELLADFQSFIQNNGVETKWDF